MVANKSRNPGKGQGSKQPGDLAALLVDCRAHGKLSLDQVAQAIGLTKKTISNIERGLHRPRRTTFLLLKEFLAKRGYFVKEAA